MVTYGGSVKAKQRQVLDEISPFLFERMAGRAGYQLQLAIKKCFDPKNVLHKDKMFPIAKKYDKMGIFEKLQRENKQFNFYMNKFGMGI